MKSSAQPQHCVQEWSVVDEPAAPLDRTLIVYDRRHRDKLDDNARCWPYHNPILYRAQPARVVAPSIDSGHQQRPMQRLQKVLPASICRIHIITYACRGLPRGRRHCRVGFVCLLVWQC